MPDLSLLETLVRIAWLAGAVAFVLGLIQMNSPATARNGNLLSAGGMAVAIIATIVFLLLRPSEGAGFNAVGWVIIAVGIALGGGLGLYTARTVKMTAMPQLVSLFNAVGGGARPSSRSTTTSA
jgi:NAD(P) transhydrogenase subunit beta